jgi:hypothetical protein
MLVGDVDAHDTYHGPIVQNPTIVQELPSYHYNCLFAQNPTIGHTLWSYHYNDKSHQHCL